MAGQVFSKGDRVRLLRLEQSFYSGLDRDDIPILQSLVGREWLVEGAHEETGQVELVYPHRSGSSPLRWIIVPPNWIERIE